VAEAAGAGNETRVLLATDRFPDSGFHCGARSCIRPPVSARNSQTQVAVVAERGCPGGLAGAEHHRPRARRGPVERLKAVAFVRAAAERLAFRAPAAAPPVGLARHQVERDRL